MPNTKSPSLENPGKSLNKTNTILSELTNASILLALITSLLYISGATFIDSYLAEWGVEPNLITNNVQDVLVRGASIWFVGGTYIMILAVVIGAIFLLPFYMVFDISKSPLVRMIITKVYKALKLKEREELDPPVILQSIAKFLRQFLVLLIFLSFFLLVFYKLLEFSSTQGKEIAKNEYKEFSTGTITNDNIFTRKKLINISGEDKEGYILANSNSLVVLYLPASKSKEEHIMIVQLSSVSNIKALKNYNIITETKK